MQHLDEGTIHAWLDGALTVDEDTRAQQHASECAECAAMVAEARGLVAGASRILSALDDVPAVTPDVGRAAPRARRPFWSRPATLAVAASVILMAGTAIVWQEGARPRSREVLGDAAPAVARTEAATAPVTEPAPSAQRESSAVVRAARDARRRAAPARAPAAVDQRASTAGSPASRVAAKEVAVAPPAPALPAATNEAAKAAAPPVAQLSEAIVTGASADTVAVQRRAAARRAAASRSRSERAIPTTAAEAPQVASRVDTVYQSRADTVARVDTLIVDAPARPGLRAPGRAEVVVRPFPVTGCYEVVEGGLPKPLTLTTKPVWSGVAEQRFVANVPGAVGYWSQPRSGDVIVVVAGALVTARIDVSTGELRGTVRRGRGSKAFVARRCR